MCRGTGIGVLGANIGVPGAAIALVLGADIGVPGADIGVLGADVILCGLGGGGGRRLAYALCRCSSSCWAVLSASRICVLRSIRARAFS